MERHKDENGTITPLTFIQHTTTTANNNNNNYPLLCLSTI
jgi:hypothetical protein